MVTRSRVYPRSWVNLGPGYTRDAGIPGRHGLSQPFWLAGSEHSFFPTLTFACCRGGVAQMSSLTPLTTGGSTSPVTVGAAAGSSSSGRFPGGFYRGLRLIRGDHRSLQAKGYLSPAPLVKECGFSQAKFHATSRRSRRPIAQAAGQSARSFRDIAPGANRGTDGRTSFGQGT